MTYRMILVVSSFWIGALGCSSDDGGSSAEPDMVVSDTDAMTSPDQGNVSMEDMTVPPALEIIPAEFVIPMLGSGERVIRSVELSNPGASSVEITRFTMETTDGSAALSYGPRQLVGITPGGTDSFNYPVVIEGGESLELAVEYTLGEGEPGGQVTLEGNFTDDPVVLPIRALDSVGQVALNTNAIDFGRVRENTTATQDIILTNAGQAPLTIHEIAKERGTYYSLAIGDVDPLEDASSYADPDGDGVAGLAPGASLTVTVTFAPTRESAQQSQVIFRTDDPIQPEARVTLEGNMNPGCIEVSPEALEWMGPSQVWTESPMVTVSNCGESPLVIDRIALLPGTDAFELNEGTLPPFPATVDAGAAPLTFTVNYGPPYPRVYRGQVEILSNDPSQPTIYLSVRASTPCAGDEECPEDYQCVDQSCLLPDGE